MASALVRLRLATSNLLKSQLPLLYQVAYAKGKPPELAKTFEEKISEFNQKDPELDKSIYIGLPIPRQVQQLKKLHKEWKVARKVKEKESRLQKLVIPLDEVKREWLKESWVQHQYLLAEHYGIFRDFFDNAFFYPQINLQVFYDYDEKYLTPVYSGNRLYPSETVVPPYIEYETPTDTLWTLVMSSPDEHFQDNDAEYLHWFIGNIPGDQLDKGEVICDYLQPFPPRGTGFHRYIFILYQQNKHLDFSSEKLPPKCVSLEKRTFKTLEFYRKFQANLTPGGLAFFNSEWDSSVKQVFHDVLAPVNLEIAKVLTNILKHEMPEPVFEFCHPPNYHPKQRKYPHKQPFNRYLDRYRDTRDIQEEVLREKLSIISPFKENPPRPKYPNSYRIPNHYAQWIKTKIQNKRLKRMQWQDLP